MIFTEEQLKSYSKPLSVTEESRCKNAIKMLSDALVEKGYSQNVDIRLAYEHTLAYTSTLTMGDHKIKLLVQGSYANNTNVRTESDVDVAVIQENVFKTRFREDTDKSSYGFISSDYTYEEFKSSVYDMLVSKFTKENVERKDKCILVNGNSYRVDADSVPSRRYKDYRYDYSNNPDNYTAGIVIYPDSGGTIINYPEQHIQNGRNKNTSTNSFYKKMVRIIKKIRYMMIDSKIDSAEEVNSFMLESLLWNIPDYKYNNNQSYIDMFQGIINYIIYIGLYELDDYREVNNIKKLCPNTSSKSNLIKYLRDSSHFFKS